MMRLENLTNRSRLVRRGAGARAGATWLIAVLVAGLSIGVVVCAETASTAASPAITPPKPPVPGPPLPQSRSPVDIFRELLGMNAVERNSFLSNRPPEVRQSITAKLREYQALPANERELRLQATELKYYLMPLLNPSATNRAARLAVIPEPTRKLVAARLEQWDMVPPAVQRDLLENEATIRYFLDLQAGSPGAQSSNADPGASLDPREQGLQRWQAMPESQRQELVRRFNQFFDLTPAEKQKALNTLSEVERRQIDKALSTYGKLPPSQRAQCLRSFEKFASLSPEDRKQFLKNAERWQAMPPAERQRWRDLVGTLSMLPPLPPGLNLRMPPLPGPPLPPRPGLHPAPGIVATNR